MFLGIDGGGTHCRARLVDARGISLGEGVAGSANLTLGVDHAAASIRAAADLAFTDAGLAPSDQAGIRAGFGLAGANVPSLAAAIGNAGFPFAAVAVASDAVAACLGAHAGRDGGILILGTGSQGLVIVRGRATAIGGWGFALSDDASGAALGRTLLRAAVAAVDGLRRRSALTETVMESFGGDPSAAVLWAKRATPRDYGAYAPLLFDSAGTGDAVAQEIIREAAAQVETMLTRLAGLGADRIALMGGLAAVYEPWLGHEFRHLLVAPEGDALEGAIRFARDGVPSS